MEEIHHHVRQFVYGTRNSWIQGQCWMKGGVGDQDHLKKTSRFTRRYSLGFLLWGYVKDIVYLTNVRDITDLRKKIFNVTATIDKAMLQRTWQKTEYRVDVFRATNGAQIEVN